MTDRFLAEVYSKLTERLADPCFGVEELASQLSVSRHTVNRKLKNLLGLSSRDFIRAYRLKQAIPYLLRGYNSSETAYQVGFQSPAYFIKCFRGQFGTTPRAYARQSNKRRKRG